MFSRNLFILVLFVGQLVSSDTNSENKFQKQINIVKKIVPLGVGIAGAVLSEKAVFLAPNAGYLTGFLEDSSDWLLLPVANFKVISLFLSQNATNERGRIIAPRIISVENGQRICTLISALHGCAAAAICRYGLNRFFPS